MLLWNSSQWRISNVLSQSYGQRADGVIPTLRQLFKEGAKRLFIATAIFLTAWVVVSLNPSLAMMVGTIVMAAFMALMYTLAGVYMLGAASSHRRDVEPERMPRR